MPEATLACGAGVVRRELGDVASERPLRGLHVGTFVGVWLACFADALRGCTRRR